MGLDGCWTSCGRDPGLQAQAHNDFPLEIPNCLAVMGRSRIGDPA
jgi:hypothetical protein